MTTPTDSVVVPCPVCGGVIEIPHPRFRLQVECPDCEELFIIGSLEPLELSYALDMEEEAQFMDEDRRG